MKERLNPLEIFNGSMLRIRCSLILRIRKDLSKARETKRKQPTELVVTGIGRDS